MKFLFSHTAALGFAFAVAAFSSSGGAFAFDEGAANALAKKSGCNTCHAVDKDKMGPAYKKIAAKYKGKADAEKVVAGILTNGTNIKLGSGPEKPHKTIDTKDPKEIKNVVQWILAQ